MILFIGFGHLSYIFFMKRWGLGGRVWLFLGEGKLLVIGKSGGMVTRVVF